MDRQTDTEMYVEAALHDAYLSAKRKCERIEELYHEDHQGYKMYLAWRDEGKDYEECWRLLGRYVMEKALLRKTREIKAAEKRWKGKKKAIEVVVGGGAVVEGGVAAVEGGVAVVQHGQVTPERSKEASLDGWDMVEREDVEDAVPSWTAINTVIRRGQPTPSGRPTTDAFAGQSSTRERKRTAKALSEELHAADVDGHVEDPDYREAATPTKKQRTVSKGASKGKSKATSKSTSKGTTKDTPAKVKVPGSRKGETRQKPEDDYGKGPSDKVGSRIKGYLMARMGDRSYADLLQQGTFADGKALYDAFVPPSVTRDEGDARIIKMLVSSGKKDGKAIMKPMWVGKEDVYEAVIQQFWVACAILVEYNARFLARLDRQGKKGKVDAMNLNKAMAQRFFKQDANRMATTYEQWVKEWGLPDLFEDGDRKKELREDFVALFPVAERKRLYEEAVTWEAADPKCQKDTNGFFLGHAEQKEVVEEQTVV